MTQEIQHRWYRQNTSSTQEMKMISPSNSSSQNHSTTHRTRNPRAGMESAPAPRHGLPSNPWNETRAPSVWKYSTQRETQSFSPYSKPHFHRLPKPTCSSCRPLPPTGRWIPAKPDAHRILLTCYTGRRKRDHGAVAEQIETSRFPYRMPPDCSSSPCASTDFQPCNTLLWRIDKWNDHRWCPCIVGSPGSGSINSCLALLRHRFEPMFWKFCGCWRKGQNPDGKMSFGNDRTWIGGGWWSLYCSHCRLGPSRYLSSRLIHLHTMSHTQDWNGVDWMIRIDYAAASAVLRDKLRSVQCWAHRSEHTPGMRGGGRGHRGEWWNGVRCKSMKDGLEIHSFEMHRNWRRDLTGSLVRISIIRSKGMVIGTPLLIFTHSFCCLLFCRGICQRKPKHKLRGETRVRASISQANFLIEKWCSSTFIYIWRNLNLSP